MTNVLIVKCSDQSKWYSNQVGNAFSVISEEETEYMVREPAGYLNFISKKDVEEVSYGPA